jgi:hypothetical protein
VGHSTGLLLVGGAFILKDYLQSRDSPSEEGNDPIPIPDSVSHVFESLVGVFMVVLGVFGLWRALRIRRERLGHEEICDTEPPTVVEVEEEEGRAGSHVLRYDSPGQDIDPATSTPSFHDNVLEVDSHQNLQSSTSGEAAPHRIGQCTRHCSTKTLALLAGIVHGLAGPGGVLGVIPAVQLHNWKLAICYLSSFCISSTLTMGLFACTYGTVTSFLGNKKNCEYQIQCFSAVLCLVVGLTWLILLAIGKLDDVFP